jgi:hypothetical protein
VRERAGSQNFSAGGIPQGKLTESAKNKKTKNKTLL